MQIAEPVRVERSYVQKLSGKPEEVFPLLCPVREREWEEDWNPLMVYTKSGFAETDCVFLTGEETPSSIWVITRFDPLNYEIEIVKVTPGMTVGKIRIALSENGKSGTVAMVTYQYTAISPEGEAFVREYSEEFFEQFMQFSESALNRFLKKRKRGGNGET